MHKIYIEVPPLPYYELPTKKWFELFTNKIQIIR